MQQLDLRGLFRVRPIRQQLNPWGLFRVRQRRLPARRLSPFGSISLCETALAGRCPRRGQRARYPIFALLKCGPAFSRGVCRGTFLCSTAGPALAPRRSSAYASVSPAAKPRVRSSAPPFGFAAQNQARHFAARNHPVRLSASRPWLRHPAPLFCRPRHGCAAPGPQRQNPGACSRSVAFRPRRNRAAVISALLPGTIVNRPGFLYNKRQDSYHT